MHNYMSINGGCLILVLFKILKLLDFQPRLGIVTKTISKALNDLVHFFIVLTLILGVYWIMSYYLFGSSIDAFSSLGQAFNSNFYIMLGSTDYNDYIMDKYAFMGSVTAFALSWLVYDMRSPPCWFLT